MSENFLARLLSLCKTGDIRVGQSLKGQDTRQEKEKPPVPSSVGLNVDVLIPSNNPGEKKSFLIKLDAPVHPAEEIFSDTRIRVRQDRNERSIPWEDPERNAEREIYIDRIPSTARMDGIKKDELIWLTPDAVRRRLQVMLWTHPVFNKKPAIAEFSQTQDVETGLEYYSEGVERSPKEPQAIIDIFQKLGFTFVTLEDQRVAMIVDATIDRDRNTNGRMKKMSLDQPPVVRNGAYVEQRDVVAPEIAGKLGVRPAQFDTLDAYAISLQELVEMSMEPAPLDEYRDDTPAEAFHYPDVLYNTGDFSRIRREFFLDWLTPILGELKKDLKFQKVLEGICDKNIDRKERKKRLFELLSQDFDESKFSMNNEGYFPAEIQMDMDIPSNERRGDQNFLNSLRDLSSENAWEKFKMLMNAPATKRKKTGQTQWPRRIMLDELLDVLEHVKEGDYKLKLEALTP